MSGCDDIRITNNQIIAAKEKIPEGDFIDRQYDVDHSQELKGLFFLLSTPRSGSTMICDLLYKSGFCLTHEYFQPSDYLPILSDRWGCIKADTLDKEMFVKQLIRFRTLKSGWLGLNLHGHHLPIFYNFKEYFPDTERIFVRLRRRDIIAQAVSYEIARQTGKWSSEFQSDVQAIYSFDNIKSRINMIKQQETITDVFVTSVNEKIIEVIYEDFLLDPVYALSAIVPGKISNINLVEASINKQSSSINKEWVSRFTKEFVASNGAGITAKNKLRILFKQIAKKIFYQ